MNEQDHRVVKAMALYGGGFVKKLAAAAERADPINLQKIKDTWPEYWEIYTDMAKKMR